MTTYEGMIAEDGDYFVQNDDGVDVLKLPVLALHEGMTVCEFWRLEPTLSYDAVVWIIRQVLLTDLLDGAYDADWLQLIDLAERQWTKAPRDSPVSAMGWTSVGEAWPDAIETRQTALEGAPRHQGLARRSYIEGYRFKWRAACASPDGTAIATVHGNQGTLWVARLLAGADR